MQVVNAIEPTPHGKMTNAAVERSWQRFISEGSTHSAQGLFLTHIINRCEREGVMYKLIAMPNFGYFIIPCNEFGDDKV